MKIRVSVIGFPEITEPIEVVLPDPQAKVIQLLDYLDKGYKPISASLMHRQACSLLINGRNVLSLPKKLLTELSERDEVVLTVQVLGG